MTNRAKYGFLITFLVGFLFFSSTTSVMGAEYPYSVSTGDKISYNVTILKNGTDADWLIVKGLNLSKGDNFYIEIFDRPANPSFPYGSEFEIRFVKGDDNGDSFQGNSMIFTSNTTFWESSSTNKSFDVGGTIYSYTYEGNLATWAWTTDADNFVIVTFDITDGLLQSFERKTDNFAFYGYTHFKFLKGSKSSIPGLELPIFAIGMLFIVLVIRRNKRD